MMNELQLVLLGNAEVRRNGVPVPGFNSGKAQALLFYLAVTGRPHTRPALAGLLWGELPEDNARTNLRKALSNLRRLVGPHLSITRQTAAFNRDSLYWLDVEVFETKASSASTKGDITPLCEAVGLYRGDFLEGFYVRQAPAFEEWALAHRARLRALALQALHTLAVHCTQQGEARLADGIDYTTRLLALEPWREEAHRQLMLLLARSGQRGAALAQYETCRQVLAEELGVEPGHQTKDLNERIRDGDVGEGDIVTAAPQPGGPAPPPPDTSVSAKQSTPRHNLPLQPTGFVGREAELTALDELVADPEVRLINIVGPGGIGKTRLAVAAAERQAARSAASPPPPITKTASLFPNGVFFVSMAPLSSAEDIAPTIAKALNFRLETVQEEGQIRSPRQQLLDYLRQKRLLLLLDNFEHLITHPQDATQSGITLLADVLEAAPWVKILVTSRERLYLKEEQVYPIQGLDFPDLETPEYAREYSAIKLFIQSARRARPDFEPEANDVIDLIRICRIVEGMPLGVELAASWVDMLSLADIAAEIRRDLDFLETEVLNVPERHRSVRAVFDTSWQRLSEAEQGVFSQLSVFRGGFTRKAAQEVTATREGPPASLRHLSKLASKSLLQYDKTRDRYEIHELLRQYGADKLAENPAYEAKVHNRHCAYYCAALQQREADLKGARQQAALAEIEADLENARAAWGWAVAQEQYERLDQALDSLSQFYEWRGRYQEGERACRTPVAKLAAKESCDEQRILAVKVLARVLAWQGVFSWRLGNPKLASGLLKRGFDLLDDPRLADQDTRSERAFILMSAGRVAYYAGDRQEAKLLLERGLALYRNLDDHWGTANALQGLSTLAVSTGAYNEARQLGEEGLALRQALNDREGIAQSLYRLGLISLYQGQSETSKQFLRESIALHQELGALASAAKTTGALGLALKLSGEYVQARGVYEQTVEMYQDLGIRDGNLGHYQSQLGNVTMHLGKYEEAKTHVGSGLKLTRESGDQRSIALSLGFLARILLAQEEYAEAQQRLQEGIAIYRAIEQRPDLAWALTSMSVTAYGLGDISRAEQYAYKALAIAATIQEDVVFVFGDALAITAYLLAKQGKTEQAVELYALASRYPYVANSRWFEDVVGRHVSASAATLSPEVVEAACARGQALDSRETIAKLLQELPKLGWSITKAKD